MIEILKSKLIEASQTFKEKQDAYIKAGEELKQLNVQVQTYVQLLEEQGITMEDLLKELNEEKDNVKSIKDTPKTRKRRGRKPASAASKK